MTAILDPYRILGVAASASPDEIKRAYHRLAKLFHPDVNESEAATEMMRIANLAFEATGGQPSRTQPEDDSLVPTYQYAGDACAFRMPFGKHRGQRMSEVYQTDAQYFHWLWSRDDLEPALAALVAELMTHIAERRAECGWA